MSDVIVDIRKLSTVFTNGKKESVVHKDLDLTIERGEFLSLVGGSGTGKTVLLREMLGLEEPTSGEITVLGRPAAELGKRGAARRVGMLFQHGALFSAFTVLENIAFPLRELKTLPRSLIYEAAMVKLVSTEWGARCLDHAIQIHGAMGESLDLPLTIFYRYLRHAQIGGGTSEIQRVLMARKLLKG